MTNQEWTDFDPEGLTRRSFLHISGTGIAGVTLDNSIIEQDANETPETDLRPRPDNVIGLWGRPLFTDVFCYHQCVPPETEIEYTLTWRTCETESRADLQSLQDIIELTVSTGDHTLTTTDGDWEINLIDSDDSGQQHWRLIWRSVQPAKSPGTYTYETKKQFTQPYENHRSDGSTDTRHGTYRYEGRYHVLSNSELRELATHEPRYRRL